MSCPHGNPISGCDTCDEVDAAFEAGKRSALAEQPASKPWVNATTWRGLTDEEVLIMSRYDLEYAALIGEVQRKLKEKNSDF